MVPVGSYRFSRGMPGGVDPLIKVGRLDKLYSVKLHGFWLVGVTGVKLMVLMGWLFCPRLPSAKLFCPKLLPARLVFAVLVDIFFLFEGPSSWIIRVFLLYAFNITSIIENMMKIPMTMTATMAPEHWKSTCSLDLAVVELEDIFSGFLSLFPYCKASASRFSVNNSFPVSAVNLKIQQKHNTLCFFFRRNKKEN